jgi:hypothetical protein
MSDVGKFVVERDLSGKDAPERGLLFLSFVKIGVMLYLGVFDPCSIFSWLDSVCLSSCGNGGVDEVKIFPGGFVGSALSMGLSSNDTYMGGAVH